MPSTHNVDKPWDTDDIDKWKIDAFTNEDNKGGAFAEESSFSVLFPKYKENYLREAWPLVVRSMKPHHVKPTLDLIEGSMSVSTTLKTFDPAAILKCRDVIKLLARSVPVQQALRMLNEESTGCDVIKIKGLTRTKEKFVKRRQRILGPNGSTLKAIELLTECYLLVQGNTVSAIGPYKGLKEIRRIVEDCIGNNVHPVYHVKELMIKRELAKDPDMKDQSWDRYLPQYKKRTLSKRRVPHRVNDKTKKTYTPFPPPQEQSKIDKQIESGEYFLSKQAKERSQKEKRMQEQREKQEEKKRQRDAAFEVPKEDLAVPRKKSKRKTKADHEGDVEMEA